MIKFLAFSFSFQLFSTKNIESTYFDQCLECAAPKCCLKFCLKPEPKIHLLIEWKIRPQWWLLLLPWPLWLRSTMQLPLPHSHGSSCSCGYRGYRDSHGLSPWTKLQLPGGGTCCLHHLRFKFKFKIEFKGKNWTLCLKTGIADVRQWNRTEL